MKRSGQFITTPQSPPSQGGKVRLGILGGSFNPIHIGHLIVAEEVYRCHRLSKVLFVPLGYPPHKTPSDLADASHRYEMVKEAINGNPHFEISDIEIKRTGKSYTIDTVESILGLYKGRCELYLIMGDDTLQELPSWKDVKRLLTLCHFVTVNRQESMPDIGTRLAGILGDEKVSEMAQLRVEIPTIGISSTDIRARIKNGQGIKYLVPSCVEAYIMEKKLYA
ncbi:MAG TPA: nicotinate-nucleotide adenylyltransferase [Candidatus Brocadiia bacterium]|nr:nicotinate-nucleotide adenylyltransferase [Candidatus Brocadiales bacterium]